MRKISELNQYNLNEHIAWIWLSNVTSQVTIITAEGNSYLTGCFSGLSGSPCDAVVQCEGVRPVALGIPPAENGQI